MRTLPPVCPGCRNTLAPSDRHEVGSPDCEEARRERDYAQAH